MYRLVATCGFGVESVLAYEIRSLGFADVVVTDGRIYFSADGEGIAKANLWLRTAERILLVLKEFDCPDFDSLYDQAQTVDWAAVIGPTDAFPVKGYSINSALTSIPACQSVLKKSIVEKLRAQYHTSSLPESGTEKKIRFSITKNQCLLMLDTSGDGLHKRGYRPLLNEAHIKETLAAAIVDFARVRTDSIVEDPFCGSGTLLIESAMRACNRAPGLHRRFAAEHYDFLPIDAFQKAREEAKALERKPEGFQVFGSDLDPKAVEVAKDNAKRAGVEAYCHFSVQDARTFAPHENAIILANPPYGERLSSQEEAQELMAAFGAQLKAGKQKSAYIISSLPEFEHVFGTKATRRRKLYNGMIPCQLYMYF